MTQPSILFPIDQDCSSGEALAQPPFFQNANIDQIVSDLVQGRGRYDLVPFFRFHPENGDTVRERQSVFRDLDDAGLRSAIIEFTQAMRESHEAHGISERLRHPSQKKGGFSAPPLHGAWL
jgi:hypothetical protein